MPRAVCNRLVQIGKIQMGKTGGLTMQRGITDLHLSVGSSSLKLPACEIPVSIIDYGVGKSIKLHRFHDWAQTAHMTLVRELLTADDLAWVYTKHRSRTAHTNLRVEKVHVRTWISKISGTTSIREFTIHDASEATLLFERSTVSIALDRATLKPTNKDLSGLSYLIAGEPLALPPMALQRPESPESFSVTRTIEPDDFDFNHHVNNAAYIRWVHDAMARRLSETEGRLRGPKRVTDLQIRYLRTISAQTTATLRCSTWARDQGLRDWEFEIACDDQQRPAAIVIATSSN
jgi:acyl-CoA thioesterase FadM